MFIHPVNHRQKRIKKKVLNIFIYISLLKDPKNTVPFRGPYIDYT